MGQAKFRSNVSRRVAVHLQGINLDTPSLLALAASVIPRAAMVAGLGLQDDSPDAGPHQLSMAGRALRSTKPARAPGKCTEKLALWEFSDLHTLVETGWALGMGEEKQAYRERGGIQILIARAR